MNKRLISIFISLVILVLFFMVSPVNADSTDWVSPENFYYVYDEFSNAEEVFEQDDTYALSDLDSRADEQDWYDCDLSEITGLSGNPTIDGIIVSFDAYAGGSSQQYEIKLTWDSGSSWTAGKNSASLPTVDTDTYLEVGGSSDTWGRTWSKNDFIPDEFGIYFHHNAGGNTNYLDHVRVKVYYTYVVPSEATCVHYELDNTKCSRLDVKWVKGTNADYTHIRYSTLTYPASVSSGTFLTNTTSASKNWAFPSYGEQYFLGIWSYNTTYNSWSTRQEGYVITPCNNAINLTINIVNCSVTNETSYSKVTGWDITINATNNGTVLNEEEKNCTGSVTSYYNSSQNKYIVNASYESVLILYENIENATGTHESIYVEFMEHWRVWANYTGNETGGGCELTYFNYSDQNITINITYWGCNTTNTSNYAVNETNWLDLLYGSVSFDNTQYGIFVLLCLFFFFFTNGYKVNKRSGGALMLMSGFVLFSLEYATAYLLDNYFVLALMSPLAIFIIILGIRKLLYPTGKEKTKTEAQ